MDFLTNMNPTPVLQELVELASKHTGLKVTCRLGGQTYAEMDWVDAAEAHDDGYHPDPTIMALFAHTDPEIDLTPFWDELDRLKALIKQPLNEPILDDDYPVHQGYMYIANGKPKMFIDGMNMTVGRWKALRIENIEPVTEVRRCDMVGRQHRLPLEKPQVSPNQMSNGATLVHESANGQRHRRSRPSNKIKKVK